jgi:ABC-2 type transport system permease protein
VRADRLRRIGAIAHIETLTILRDKRSLVMAFVFPLLLLILFGSTLSYDVTNIPLAVWDQDHTPASRALISSFKGSPYYHIVAIREGYPELIRDLDRNKALVVMIIPPDFAKRLKRRQEVPVQFILDGADSKGLWKNIIVPSGTGTPISRLIWPSGSGSTPR